MLSKDAAHPALRVRAWDPEARSDVDGGKKVARWNDAGGVAQNRRASRGSQTLDRYSGIAQRLRLLKELVHITIRRHTSAALGCV